LHINNTTREKPTLFIIECSFNIFTFTIKFSIYIKQKAEGAELYTSGDKIRNIQNCTILWNNLKTRKEKAQSREEFHNFANWDRGSSEFIVATRRRWSSLHELVHPKLYEKKKSYR